MIGAMPRFVPDPDILRLGEALAALRRERGLSQAEAGARLDMTSQGWGLYESGRRPGLFRPDVQRRLTAALDASPEDLAMILSRRSPEAATAAERAAETAGGVASRDRAWSGLSATIERLVLSTDELSPWAVSGVVLEFRPGQWPRRGQGCVVDMADGTRRVRLYEGADAETLRLAGAGALDRVEVVAREAVAAMSAVTARLDQ